MNKAIYLVAVLILGLSLSSMKPSLPEGVKPHIQFENVKHNFGVFFQNGDGNWEFKFTNTGKEPLIIQNVHSSCGCTIAKRPSAPILPGQSSSIKVRYDTRRIGVFRKTITVTSNADNASIILEIRGEIKNKPKEEVPVRPVNEGFTPIAK
ncbi:MAG: hypothetical protein DRI84_07275 [Bacteroidetes bacterium]|nr:MAG: hypothetical protein DRI84_07275 [Bacteroidota bacterium]